MDYILFETQSNFAQLVCFSCCGGVFGTLSRLFNRKNSIAISAVTFFLLAISVVTCSAFINKSHVGYQTFLVPLLVFFTIKNA
ncbi:MAG: hypothetical protein R3Y32_04365 [Bacillota bacterium]